MIQESQLRLFCLKTLSHLIKKIKYNGGDSNLQMNWNSMKSISYG